MVKVSHLEKKLGDFYLKNISFELPPGYIMGLIGENGAGKTSLLHLLLGLYQPLKGEIELFGTSYRSREKEIKNQIGYVLGDEDLFAGPMKLMESASLYGKYYENYSQNKLEEYGNQFQLNLKKKWKECSKGEKLKFQFAFALAHQPKLLILDEPTANFDSEFRKEFFQVITDFVSDGKHSVILATHQMEDLERIADYVTFLHEGNLVFSNDRETLENRFRIVQGEDYKVKLLKPERIIYMRKGKYGTSALVMYRKVDCYDNALTVNRPGIADIMYYAVKGGSSGLDKLQKHLQ